MTIPISPKDLIKNLTVEELCITAEEYYKSVKDSTYLQAKPFYSLVEMPDMLHTMGILLSGLRLGKTMKILDFGAGPCWFSRYLNQMQCQTISTDVSTTALEMGKKLFKEYPIVGEYIVEPIFLPFDGHKIDLPDNSVDRILCYDVFHHVPNQEEIISEFGRVLKPGGIVGFCEPGRHHSQSTHSQNEMRNYTVLENDIDINEIFTIAKQKGFTDISLKLLSNGEISLDDYNNIVGSRRHIMSNIPNAVNTVMKTVRNVRTLMTQKTVFFLYKGPYVADSRDFYGLAHCISVKKGEYTVKICKDLSIPVKVQNTGMAIWLNKNIRNIGVVKIGTHLYDENDHLLMIDHTRHLFDKEIHPGETIEKDLTFNFNKPGKYKIVVDLVSEGVTWFETVGSRPTIVTVSVE